VHLALQEIFELGLKGALPKQAHVVIKLDAHIEVAVGSCFAAHDRAKDPYRSGCVAPHDTVDLVPSRSQLVETWWRAGRAWIWVGTTLSLYPPAEFGQLMERGKVVSSGNCHGHQVKRRTGESRPVSSGEPAIRVPSHVPNTAEMTQSDDTSAHLKACNHALKHVLRGNGKEGVVGSSPTEGSHEIPGSGMELGIGDDSRATGGVSVAAFSGRFLSHHTPAHDAGE
jgi:hypothetical protein